MVVVTLVQPLTARRISVAGPLLKLRSDEQLLAAFRAGNEGAFSVIVDRYSPRLLRYTRRMLGSNAAEAEDVLQDVFVRAYRSLSIDNRDLPLKAWLYRVAHNRCVDHLRRPVTDNESVYEMNRPAECDPHVQFEQREALRRLVKDVGELPEQQRSALLLRELEGLSYGEVANALAMTVPAVKSLLVRARGGLLDAQTAQDTACKEIRADLDGSRARGVRMSGLARRHMLTCSDCRHYHSRRRGYDRAVAAVDGGPGPIAAIAKLLGFGSVGGSAAAATAGGSGTIVGGTFLSAAAVKTVAVVATAVVIGGGAVEATQHPAKSARSKSAAKAQMSVRQPTAITAPLTFVRKLSDAAAAKADQARPHLRHVAQLTIAPPSPTIADRERGQGDEGATSPELLATGGAAAPSVLADEPVVATEPATTPDVKTETAATTTPTTTATPTQSLQASTTPTPPPAPATAAAPEPAKARPG